MSPEDRPLRGKRTFTVTTRNSAFQHVETLKRNRVKRTRNRELVIEGVIPIEAALRHSLAVTRIYCRSRNSLSRWALEVIDASPDAGIYELTDELLSELSDKEESSEILLVASQPDYRTEELGTDRIVVLDRPSSPGNLGTILRSCNSFGVDALLISGHGADPYDPKCITASRGTSFALPVVSLESNAALEAVLERARGKPGFTLFGSSAAGGVELGTAPRPDRFGLVVGNETTGMSDYLSKLVDVVLTIPMTGEATSLNVACATSILLYELTRARITRQ